ncbi:GAF domain-containing sensor histidine kinase [bacterium]|nr:GAF domain-containing sensor histidine kinase [bacterium]
MPEEKKIIPSQEIKDIETLIERNKAFAATASLNSTILQTLDFNLLTKHIANSIPEFLGYQTAVLAIVDETHQTLKRVAVSDTASAHAALQALEIPFGDIDIKLSDKENYCIKSIDENNPHTTSDLYDVLRPTVSRENASVVQKAMGTKTTLIYPIFAITEKKALGVFLVSVNKSAEDITEFEKQTLSNFVDGIRIALVNANLYTSLNNITEELRAANEHLKEMDRMKSEFVSIASHQLRTPLTAIKGYASMLAEGSFGKLSEKMTEPVGRILQSADNLVAIIEDFLNLSRIEKGTLSYHFAKMDMEKLTYELVAEFKPRAEEKGLALSFTKDGLGGYATMADEGKMRQIISNLLDNSIKYTPKGEIKVHLSHDRETGKILLCVSDTGIGIAPGDMPHLFLRFSRGSKQGGRKLYTEGTGLGLYVAKEMMTAHRGRIWGESEGSGKGSKFYLELSAKQQP